MMDLIKQKSISYARHLWSVCKLAMFSVGVLTTVIGLLLVTEPKSPPPPSYITVSMTSELEHRINVCQTLIDKMSPSHYDTAAFQCGMMWQQSNKLKSYLLQTKTKDRQAVAAIFVSMQTMYRFGEYASMLHAHINPEK